MLAEYHNDVFNAKIQGDKVNIWKYVPADGLANCNECITHIWRRIMIPFEKVYDATEKAFNNDEISMPF